MDYDKTEIAKTYKQGRDYGPEFLQHWMEVVASHVDTQNVRSVLDLGCGTGRFSEGLATRLDADVVGTGSIPQDARRSAQGPAP
jgi:cyclopropane fatty-acyl-phospholipid synthase-like methyltransferase